MKIRHGFISNSSSSSFIIRNISSENKTLVDFVKENPQLIDDFKNQYDWYKTNPEFTQENLLASAEENNDNFPASSGHSVIFGDQLPNNKSVGFVAS